MPIDVLNSLIPQGTVLPGMTPNVIEDGVLHGPDYQTDRLSTLSRALEKHQTQQRAVEQEQLKREEKRMDMYKTLRDSGYDPGKAYEAVMKMEFPRAPGGETVKEKEVAVKKMKAMRTSGIEKAKGEGIEADTNRKKLVNRILQKVADDVSLKSGEQKVYDEYLRKYGNRSDVSDIESAVKKKTEVPSKTVQGNLNTTGWVKMVNDKGKKVSVHPDDVQKVLKKGWKLR